jgi:hypothetical protein
MSKKAKEPRAALHGPFSIQKRFRVANEKEKVNR